MKIRQVKARQILDSRGNPTVEAEVHLENGQIALASVPSGASTGEHEAVELRDGEMVHFWGKGVMRAVENIEKVIGPALKGIEVAEQREIDERMIELDGTENKGKLGANAILAVSLAVARAASESEGVELYEYLSKFRGSSVISTLRAKREEEKSYKNKNGGIYAGKDFSSSPRSSSEGRNDNYILPVPFMNVINGGKHAPEGSDFQEYMIVPHGFNSFSEALESADEVFMKLKEILHERGLGTLVGDEGGFAPALKRPELILDLLMRAIEEAGFEAGKDISLAMDAAASEIKYQKSNSKNTNEKFKYHLKKQDKILTSGEMVNYWVDLVGRYPIVSLEDALGEDDWEGWRMLMEEILRLPQASHSLRCAQDDKADFKSLSALSNKTRQRNNERTKLQLVGDDLLVTDPKRLQRAIDEKACNAILIKLNQIGTLTETIDVINLAQANGFGCMISHRSGETEDTFVADLAVGMGCGQIKAGSLTRSERVAKYNRLLRIEEKLKEKYAG